MKSKNVKVCCLHVILDDDTEASFTERIPFSFKERWVLEWIVTTLEIFELV
jgi:hypothetical protein